MRATRALITAAVVGLMAAGIMSMAAPAPPANQFVVHEWGTFSSFSGSDGKPLAFIPANTDLPKFVYSAKTFSKGSFSGLVSLETPVTYFYSSKPMTATVRAEFPEGTFTEWFPKAVRADGRSIQWTDIRIRPGDMSPLPTLPGENHYYAARETDATPIELVLNKEGAKETVEHEKFLFYRGVGNPKLPVAVTAQGGSTFTVRASNGVPISAAVVVEVNAGKVRFKTIDALAANQTVAVTLPDGSDPAPVRAELVRLLTAAGLFDKEARAMVKTWESAWLKDEGARVLYVLPGTWADKSLPLTVTPKPDTMVRVMVGRHDVMTPEREKELDRLIGRQTTDKKAAESALAKLGRFAGPAREQAELRLKQR